MFAMLRLFLLVCGLIVIWPFARVFRKQLNEAKAKLNAAGLPATIKNIFFMEAVIAEAERRERDRILAELDDTIDSELADARASRRMLADGQQEKIGSK